MSSPETPSRRRGITRRALLGGLAATTALALGGCFTPLYGPTASGGSLEAALAGIEVAPVVATPEGDVLAHQLRQELVFALDGSGTATTEGRKDMRLVVTVTLNTRLPVIDAATLRASIASVLGTATWRLETPDGTRVLRQGVQQATVSYERNVQRFATVRAARDAEIRLANLLAEQIRTQVALALRTGLPLA